MAGATNGGLIFMSIILLGLASFFIGYLSYIGYKMLGNTRNALLTTPNRYKYNSNDFYDEPDGFYVTLPNGEVRID